MEGIWIRSQDKSRLMLCKSFGLCHYSQKTVVEALDGEFSGIVGTYATKERAVEVLGEIQEHIDTVTSTTLKLSNAHVVMSEDDLKSIFEYVFQMPAE